MEKPLLATTRVEAPEPDQSKRFGSRLRRKQAAKYIGASEGFLEKAAVRRCGGPPFLRLSRRLIVYDVSDLDAWMAKRRVDCTTEEIASPRRRREFGLISNK